MLTSTILLNFRHPAMYLPRSNNIYLAEDSITEVKEPVFQHKRRRWITIVDPYDLVGLCMGRDKKGKYWENHERVLPNGALEVVSMPKVQHRVTE